MIDKKNHRFEAQVEDGQQNNVKIVIKVPPEIMADIIKGSDQKYVMFKLLSKGWFSEKTVAEAEMDLNFIRSNVMEDRLTIKEEKIYLDYLIKVRKPKRPIITEINTYKLTKYPPYEHSKFMEDEFLKTVMQFSKPTAS